MDIRELIHKHMQKYSVELQTKLEDLSTAYTSSYKEAVIGVIRHQVQVLEARMDTLRDLEEDITQP